jgi:hypothetical protein
MDLVVVASGQQRVKIRCVSWAVNQYTHGSAHNQQSLGAGCAVLGLCSAISESHRGKYCSHLSARVPVIVQVNVAKSYYHAVASNLYQFSFSHTPRCRHIINTYEMRDQ